MLWELADVLAISDVVMFCEFTVLRFSSCSYIKLS